jgi:arsenate reductase
LLEETLHYPIRVLFLRTGNSARSQMAEGLLRACSAGTESPALHPLAVEAMCEADIDVSHHESKPRERFPGQSFDYIITVCDRARDNGPMFPGDHQRIHRSFDDPAAAAGSNQQRRADFRPVHNEIGDRLRPWITAQRKRLRDRCA